MLFDWTLLISDIAPKISGSTFGSISKRILDQLPSLNPIVVESILLRPQPTCNSAFFHVYACFIDYTSMVRNQ